VLQACNNFVFATMFLSSIPVFVPDSSSAHFDFCLLTFDLRAPRALCLSVVKDTGFGFWGLRLEARGF